MLPKIRTSSSYHTCPKFGEHLWFGYTIGTAYSDTFYLTCCFAGAASLLAGIAYPYCLIKPARQFQYIMGKFGHFIFSVLLSLLYFILLSPLALLTRTQQRFPATRWEREIEHSYGWQCKATNTYTQNDIGTKNIFSTITRILRHFIHHGQWYLLPLIVLMLALGVLLFFAQTSVVAPFIYTLF